MPTDPCSRPVATRERDIVLDTVAKAGESGLTMGAIVQSLEQAGHRPESIEMVIWTLMGEQRLVPNGFICRTLRRRDDAGKLAEFRTYEFVLIVAPDQLELLP